MDDYDVKFELDNDIKRERRRRKRIRGMVFSWVFTILFFIAIGCGSYYVIVNYGDKLTGAKVSSASFEPDPVISASINEVTPEPTPEPTGLITGEDDIVVSTKVPIDVAPTEAELFTQAVEAFVNSMSVEDKVCGLFIVSPEAITGVKTVTRAGDGTRKALEKYAVGGLLYGASNAESVSQFSQVISNSKEYARYPLFFASFEEPGHTVILNKLKYADTDTAAQIYETQDAIKAYYAEQIIADQMLSLGLNVNFGIMAEPVVSEANNCLGDRAFGLNPDISNQMVSMAVNALVEKNISAGLMFFPGQSTASQDTQKGVATSLRTLEEFKETEMESFLNGVRAGADFIVVSHAYAPDITGDAKMCSCSKTCMTDLVRYEMKLDDVIVVTDRLDKAAVTDYYTSDEIAVDAIKAGADMLMCPENFEEAYKAVLEAVNTNVISIERVNDSLKRIYNVKFRGLSSDAIYAMISE